ncbi:protein kinase family protein [Acidaminobacter sp. JC074]|uniref:protein kinase domain-containing protein n=1 Tax=Acidaminobacter sp. JC074 TaxID=2530199 RepID=UPI001F0DDCD7|nr:protein kinase [Acidaminobacter sp. JC074]MCH4887136.1 protein kinase family protein [Acidaminobacter sp. JC074]
MFTLQCLDDIKTMSSEQLKHSDSLPPTALLNNQYEILFLEGICQGSFLYKAIDLKRDVFVTIKEFFPRDAIGYEEQLYLVRDYETLSLRLMDETPLRQKQYEKLLESFLEEANYLEKVSHGSPILKIQESFYDKNTAYLVFNYNKWPTLQDFIDTKYQFNTQELKWLTKELVDMISRFHKREIVHRNINPKNIYIKQDEILIDSIGTCDYLKDIKIFDADAYECRYYAPEIIMHNGVIGTWTDVYAIGKVIIDVITSMHESGDYFEGLNMLSGELKDVYQKLAYNAIQFDHNIRTKSAVEMKKVLSSDEDSSYFRTPKAVIAMIAMISFFSCLILVWQYNNDTMMSDDYLFIEEEEVPLGQVIIEDKPCYFLLDHLVMTDTSLDIRWLKKEHVLISHLEIINSNKEILTIDLLEHQISVNISAFDLPEDKYLVKLYYKISDELLYEIMHLEIKE